jgi:hypothetical protein
MWFEVTATETVKRTYMVNADNAEAAKEKLTAGDELFAFTEGDAMIDEVTDVRECS